MFDPTPSGDSTGDAVRSYPRDTALSRALLANAVFSTLSGATLLGAPGFVASFLGAVPEWSLRVLGGGLVAFGLAVAVAASRRPVHPPTALAVTVADALWVAGSLAVTVLGAELLSGPGPATVLLVAAVVGLFGLLQLRGLVRYARNIGGRTGARSRFVMIRSVPERPEVVWRRLRALDRVDEHFDELVEVDVREIDGVTHRTCATDRGGRWTEQVLRLDDEERELVLKFDTKTGKFPIPLQEMLGGWRVRECGEGAILQLWYEYTIRGGLAGEVLAALADASFRRQLLPVLRSLGERTGRRDPVEERRTA